MGFNQLDNRIVIAALKHRILERRYAYCITHELHLAKDFLQKHWMLEQVQYKMNSNCKVIDAGGRMICLPPFPTLLAFSSGSILPCDPILRGLHVDVLVMVWSIKLDRLWYGFYVGIRSEFLFWYIRRFS